MVKKIESVGWDSGFDFEKIVISEQERVRFAATTFKPGPINQFAGLENRKNFKQSQMIVEFEGENYYIGRKAIDNDPQGGIRTFETRRFEKPETIVRFLAGILLFSGGQSVEVENLVLGLNIEDYKKYREDIVNVYKDTPFTIKIPKNDEMIKVSIGIKNCECIAQGFGAYYNEILDYDSNMKQEDMTDVWNGVIDIGGRTCDILIAQGNEPKPRTATSFSMGTASAYKEVRRQIGGSINYLLIEEKHLKKKNKAKLGDRQHNINNLCQSAFENLASRITNRVISEWDDYLHRVDSVILTGGGAEYVYDYFDENFPAEVRVNDDCQFGNAAGYHKIGKVYASKGKGKGKSQPNKNGKQLKKKKKPENQNQPHNKNKNKKHQNNN